MKTLEMEFPEKVFAALRFDSDQFADEMRNWAMEYNKDTVSSQKTLMSS